MKKIFSIIAITCIFFSSIQAQTENYKNTIDVISKNINKYFYEPATGLYLENHDKIYNQKPHSFLWPLCALLQATNEMEVLNPSGCYMKPVELAISHYYNANPPMGAYQAYVSTEELDTRYYDDNQWLGIAFIDAYSRTKKKEYLNLATGIYRFMMTGYDTITGGGIYWREGDKSSKNTCSNGPGIVLALQLHLATEDRKYLDTALLLYKWTNKYLLSKNRLFFDAIKTKDLSVDKAIYTYNTGTMLQSNVLLYRITKQKQYLDEACSIADAAEKFFYKNNRLPDNYWFNAVMLRGFIELYKVEKNKNRLHFFIKEANRVWKEETDDQHLLGVKKAKSLIDQAGMLEIYSRIQQLKLN